MINHEEMSERKLKILHAIIQNYLETGEPVGSRTISKYTDLNLSSATIRNEMVIWKRWDINPGLCVGRTYSFEIKGYRLYVQYAPSGVWRRQELDQDAGGSDA